MITGRILLLIVSILMIIISYGIHTISRINGYRSFYIYKLEIPVSFISVFTGFIFGMGVVYLVLVLLL